MQLLAQQRIVSNGMALLGFDEVWPVYSRARADDALLASTSSPKLGELRRVMRELALEQGRKVVVFSQWRKMLRLAEWAVRPLLEAEGLGSVFFTGAERQELRTKNVVDFHDDPSLRVMFLTDAGGVGLNLQRAASACVNLELPWNPAVLEQRIGRIYRLGQVSPIDVVNLVSEYGIEARIAGLVGSKKALFDGLFDGTTDAVSFGAASGFLRDVERLVEPVTVPELPPDDTESGANERAMDLSEASFHDADGATESELSRPDVSADGAASESPAAERAVTGSVPVAPGPSSDRSAALDVAALMAGLRVTHEDDGGLRIDAPPAVAQQLSQLLEGLAGLLRSAASRGNGVALDSPPSRED
jgi:superfamily II DNA/RNA helicase